MGPLERIHSVQTRQYHAISQETNPIACLQTMKSEPKQQEVVGGSLLQQAAQKTGYTLLVMAEYLPEIIALLLEVGLVLTAVVAGVALGGVICGPIGAVAGGIAGGLLAAYIGKGDSFVAKLGMWLGKRNQNTIAYLGEAMLICGGLSVQEAGTCRAQMVSSISHPIFKAIGQQDIEKVKRLLEEKPGLANIQNAQGMTPLMVLLESIHKEETVKKKELFFILLPISDGSMQDNLAQTVFHYSAILSSQEYVSSVWEKDPTLANALQFPDLWIAIIRDKNLSVQQKLERLGFFIDKNTTEPSNFSLLNCAIGSGSIDLVKGLILLGCNYNKPGARGIFPLIRAIETGNEEIIDCLLTQSDIDVLQKSPDGTTALLATASIDDIWNMRKLLEKGIESIIDWMGGMPSVSALHWAIYYDDHGMIRLLLDHKANPDLPSPANGVTPREFAAGTLSESALQ